MAICWGPDYVLLYNDAYRPIAGTRHPWALGRGAREVYPEAWDFIGPMYESVMARGQTVNYLSDALVPLTRNNYLEEVYIAFSASRIPDDNGRVGGVLNSALETTERVIEDRRRHLLRALALRAAGARSEEEVWRVSAETLGENLLSLPFAFLYEYRPSEHRAYLAGASVETDEALRPAVVDCRGENLWRFDPALAMDGVLVELGDLASGVSVPNWPERPKEASVVPFRLGEHGESVGFLVAGIHPGQEIIGRIRSQFEKGVPNQESLNVNEIIPETIVLLRDQAMRHNISIRTELAADLPQIVGDRVQLQQVAMNLIINSIEAMKDVDGTRELVIKSERAKNEQILLSFTDTGIGLPTQLAVHIFAPFFTTKPHGTGMGLRISRSIIESHGGRLWAVSSPGRGATFQFELPTTITDFG
jgi:hypothetical protein